MNFKLLKTLSLSTLAIGGSLSTLANVSCSSKAAKYTIKYDNSTKCSCITSVCTTTDDHNGYESDKYFNIIPKITSQQLLPTDFTIAIINVDTSDSGWHPNPNIKNPRFVDDSNDSNDNTQYNWRLDFDIINYGEDDATYDFYLKALYKPTQEWSSKIKLQVSFSRGPSQNPSYTLKYNNSTSWSTICSIATYGGYGPFNNQTTDNYFNVAANDSNESLNPDDFAFVFYDTNPAWDITQNFTNLSFVADNTWYNWKLKFNINSPSTLYRSEDFMFWIVDKHNINKKYSNPLYLGIFFC